MTLLRKLVAFLRRELYRLPVAVLVVLYLPVALLVVAYGRLRDRYRARR